MLGRGSGSPVGPVGAGAGAGVVGAGAGSLPVGAGAGSGVGVVGAGPGWMVAGGVHSGAVGVTGAGVVGAGVLPVEPPAAGAPLLPWPLRPDSPMTPSPPQAEVSMV